MVAAVTRWRSGKVALAPVSAFILRCALLPFAVAGASACATGSVYIFHFISQEVPINRDSHKKQRHNAVFVAVEFGILLQKRCIAMAAPALAPMQGAVPIITSIPGGRLVTASVSVFMAAITVCFRSNTNAAILP